MNDVAAHVGVSRALVSIVLRRLPGASEATREKVLRAAHELGYRPDSAARLLARHNSRVLGVVIDVRNQYHAELVEAIYPRAEQYGYDILLSATALTRDEQHAVDALIAHRCAALVLLGPSGDRPFLTAVGARIPTVAVGRRLPGTGIDAVRVSEARGVRDVVDYLVGLGHRGIAYIDGGHQSGAAERRAAYRREMRRHGLQDSVRVLPGDHTEDSGVRAARTLLAEGPLPTAVFASNDRCAVGLLDVFGRERVAVPDEVSVVGYDDSTIAQLSYVNLTTVRQDVEDTADHAVRLAVERLESPPEQVRDVVLTPVLVVRGTTGPPRPLP